VQTILYGVHVPTSATSCTPFGSASLIWRIRDLGDGITPLSFTFPTPLQWTPSPGFKACLFAFTDASSTTAINAVGFYS
jgi:hypothetical protein